MVLPGNSMRTLVGRGPPPASTQQVGQRRPRYRSRRRVRCRLRRRSPPLLAQEIPTGGDRTVRSLRRTGKGMSGRQRTLSKPNPTTSPSTTTSRPDTPTEPLERSICVHHAPLCWAGSKRRSLWPEPTGPRPPEPAPAPSPAPPRCP